VQCGSFCGPDRDSLSHPEVARREPVRAAQIRRAGATLETTESSGVLSPASLLQLASGERTLAQPRVFQTILSPRTRRPGCHSVCPAMSLGRYLIGVVALLCVLGSLGVGAAALRRYLLPHWCGAHARLAGLMIGCALLVGLMEVLGVVGLFRSIPIVLGSLAVGSALRLGLGLRSRSSAPAVRWRLARPRVSADDAVLILMSVAGLVVVLSQWTRRSLVSFGHGINGADSLAYHLPHAAFYAQTGQIRAIPYTDFEYLTGLFPATSELFHALGVVLMGNDVLSPGINLVWLALTLMAAWCIGSGRGLGFTSMLGAIVVVATPMLVGSNAGTADNDLLGVFFVTAAVALWMHTVDMSTTDVASDMGAYRSGTIIAAVAAGLALSVKLNLVGPVGALAIVAVALAPREWRTKATGWWIGGLVLAGGYWYARNLVEVGNPIPWFSFGVLPTPRPPPVQHANDYSLARYAGSLRILRHWLVSALDLNLGPWWPALVAVALVGPALCLFSRSDRVVRAVALIALASLVAYAFTPLTACGPLGHPYCMKLNMRYGASAMTLALTVLPLALLFKGRLGRLAAAAGLFTLFVTVVVRHHPWTSHSLAVSGAAVGLAVLVTAIILFRPWSLISLKRRPVRATVALIALSLVLSGAALGYSGTQDYLRHRYADRHGPSAIYRVWRWARRLHHARIAIAGTLGVYFGYPLWGLADSNRVTYIGRRGPHASFRPISSCQAWRKALNRGRYQYAVTTSNRVFFTTKLIPSPDAAWTQSDPAARLVLAPSPAIHVFRLTGRLHPGNC
jgi:hypothetical protein